MVRMTSQRYQLFASKGVTCVNCGVVGEFFGLEKSKYQEGDRYHFNLYGIKNGNEVMITKDHIIPKYWAKSGIDALGLRKFLRTEKEIKELDNCSCSCNEDW